MSVFGRVDGIPLKVGGLLKITFDETHTTRIPLVEGNNKLEKEIDVRC